MSPPNVWGKGSCVGKAAILYSFVHSFAISNVLASWHSEVGLRLPAI
jgi:hypothetical protein